MVVSKFNQLGLFSILKLRLSPSLSVASGTKLYKSFSLTAKLGTPVITGKSLILLIVTDTVLGAESSNPSFAI